MILSIKQIVKQMVLAGVHFGHPKYQRNPKMIPYIYTEKDNLQIINLLQTYKYLQNAYLFLFNACSHGKQILFVGTKKHVAKCIKKTAIDCNSWYINKRWLGGLLTNWKTMQKSISKIQKENSFLRETKKSKKEIAQQERRKKRLMKYLGGVKTMTELPDIVIIVGQQKEINAVKECQKLNIPCITILDTNCDPTLTTLFIPANDDSVTSINFILQKLSQAIQEGHKANYKKLQKNKQYKNNKYYKIKKN